jgi:lipopolysaccharide transport system ATP-binding protein
MTSSEPRVEFSRVWKKFRRGRALDSLRDFVPAMARSALGARPAPAVLRDQEFWAVQDVSFQVRPGECLGIIGPNGAGKSTVLKLLMGILAPTRGRALVQGRAGALIELAAGFHPDLTGRENVFLQGAIMGMKRVQIAREFDRIIDFAGIGEFIDTQVKRYSSGMQARLGFAIAAHLDPEVLIIDEILSVGDHAFQRTAFERLAELTRRAIPVVIVSHQLDRIAELCSKAVLLNRGSVAHAGTAAACIAQYVEAGLGGTTAGDAGPVRLTRLSIEPDLPIASGGAIRARIEGVVETPLAATESLMLRVRGVESGEPVFAVSTESGGIALPASGPFALAIDLEANLAGGLYLLEVCLWDRETRRDVSPSLRRAFQVRLDHEFLGTVNLQARFDLALALPDA